MGKLKRLKNSCLKDCNYLDALYMSYKPEPKRDCFILYLSFVFCMIVFIIITFSIYLTKNESPSFRYTFEPTDEPTTQPTNEPI